MSDSETKGKDAHYTTPTPFRQLTEELRLDTTQDMLLQDYRGDRESAVVYWSGEN